MYAALGSSANSRLAEELGLTLTDEARVPFGDHMKTSLDGVWAAGDIVAGLDRISVAMGHAAVAATSIHNWLPKPELHHENSIAASDGRGCLRWQHAV